MERFAKGTTRKDKRCIAYFSMEIGLESGIPTYSGGLGVLAGDTIKSAADLNVPIVAVTLLYRKGYFDQKLDNDGNQTEADVVWNPKDHLSKLKEKITVKIEGRNVAVTVWQYDIKGIGGYMIPILFLDTDLKENSEYDKHITDRLYGGDQKYRFCQEIVLGIGGIRILEKLGYTGIRKYHMNEGHSALLTLELLKKDIAASKEKVYLKHNDSIRSRCVFTTHTPVPAGHDQFPLDLVKSVLGNLVPSGEIESISHEGKLNMTYLALECSQHINGVAKKHGEISRQMFPGYLIDSITNGVHSATWTSKHFKNLYDKYIPGWKNDSFSLRYALNIPNNEIWNAHLKAKEELFAYIKEKTGIEMNPDAFTIGFARRSTAYKRGDLLLSNIERLAKIAETVGPIQIVYSGKAHPKDGAGKDLIRNIFSKINEIKGKIKIIYLKNYGMDMAGL
ncbi:MAG: alpha-glucan family phosphorylase, partial [Candidatus Aenigmarchaeota archaeon]|nr:alpha-glucan family phosphorylase [Candidatus Aenigmarchaeota archaeon]